MKKWICLLLCLSMAFTLAACQTEPVGTTPSTDAPTTTTVPTDTSPTPSTDAPETTEPTVDGGVVTYDLPMAAISLTEQTEMTVGKDDRTIFEYTYQNVCLQLEDADVAEAVTLDLLNRIDATRSAADRIRADAISDNPEYAYSYSLVYTPQRIDAGILSLSSHQTSYNGGAHPLTICHGVTYDLTTGNTLGLGDILADGCTADVICRLVVDALSEKAEDLRLYDDYSLIVEERFSGDFLADEDWYLSREGLCFSFTPYEIAPYSAGVVTVSIPYNQLAGILLDDFFPTEQIYTESSLCAVRFENAGEDDFSQFAELVLNQDGDSVLLYTEGLVYNLIIETGRWNSGGTVFTPESTVFAAASLVPGDAILVQAYIPEEMPSLRISYTCGDETVQEYLCQSDDGGISLLAD